MSSGTQRMLNDLRQVIADIEALVGETTESTENGTNDAQGLRATLAHVRDRFGGLEKTIEQDIRRRAQVADQYVRDNAWTSLAGAAVTAFVLGVLVGRRT